ncbi:MAG: hypothetical protein PUE19_02605, partial [bacterium]|nr:hypothetical protein [bacterium]
SHAGSCQCHESGSLTGWLYKKFAVPLVKRRIKSYIIFIVYLTERTSRCWIESSGHFFAGLAEHTFRRPGVNFFVFFFGRNAILLSRPVV